MILQSFFEVRVHPRNINHYKKLGYDTDKQKKIVVKNEDLLDGSKILEKRQCDECGVVLEREHSAWVDTHISFNKDLCPKCSRKNAIEKTKKIFQEKYGCDFPMQSQKIREKGKETCRKNYGCDYSFQNKEIQNTAKKAIKEKYGSYSELAKNEDLCKKRELTNIEKYGCKNVFQNEGIKEKIKKTLIEKYQVEYISQSKEVQEKIKETNLQKYGVERVLQNEEIKNKARDTCFERYGVFSAMQNKKIKEKANLTLYNNNAVPTSKQQLQIFNMVQELFTDGEVVLNLPLSTLCLDISLITKEGEKVDIEYDGEHWHKDENKDRRRDEFVKSNGYKILRISSKRMVPTKENLKNSIMELINSEHSFKRIFLEDSDFENKNK